MAKTKYYYVYIHICLATGKPYIGWSADPKARWRVHCAAKDNTAFHNAIRKYGREYFENHILFRTENLEEVKQKEIEFIKRFDSLVPNGYNLTIGGEGTSGAHWNLSEKTKEKMQGNKNAQGHKHSKESKKKMGHPGHQYSKGKRSKEFCNNQKGNKRALKHGQRTKESEIKRLKNRIKKLEQDL